MKDWVSIFIVTQCLLASCTSISDSGGCLPNNVFEVLKEGNKFVGKGPAGILSNKLSAKDFSHAKTYLGCNQEGRLATIAIANHYLTIVMVEKNADRKHLAEIGDLINSRANFTYVMNNMPALLLETNPSVCKTINDTWTIKSWQFSDL